MTFRRESKLSAIIYLIARKVEQRLHRGDRGQSQPICTAETQQIHGKRKVAAEEKERAGIAQRSLPKCYVVQARMQGVGIWLRIPVPAIQNGANRMPRSGV